MPSLRRTMRASGDAWMQWLESCEGLGLSLPLCGALPVCGMDGGRGLLWRVCAVDGALSLCVESVGWNAVDGVPLWLPSLAGVA